MIKDAQPLLKNAELVNETNRIFGSDIDVNALTVSSNIFDPRTGEDGNPIGTYSGIIESSGRIFDRFNLPEGSLLVVSSLADPTQPTQILPFTGGDGTLLTIDGILANTATAVGGTIVNGSGAYKDATGSARLSGMVFFGGPPIEGTELSEDCLWVIKLSPSVY